MSVSSGSSCGGCGSLGSSSNEFSYKLQNNSQVNHWISKIISYSMNSL